ncbi:hypothetical protein [Peribacillus muralis]|uniref:hypothetical protein n=1 Tax=Peribacillus muralis TaxID=264697 RepID=UPI00070C0D48|nr:hypothetical protein [Peribacillus muralis]
MTALLAQLTYSPFYIITVIMALGALIFLRSEKGCLMFLIRIWAVGHVIIYLLAICFNFTKPIQLTICGEFTIREVTVAAFSLCNKRVSITKKGT